MITDTEVAKLNRQTAEMMTLVVKTRFGQEYHATRRNKRCSIVKQVSSMCVSIATGPTWYEALRSARVQFGWTQ